MVECNYKGDAGGAITSYEEPIDFFQSDSLLILRCLAGFQWRDTQGKDEVYYSGSSRWTNWCLSHHGVHIGKVSRHLGSQ